MTFPPRTRQVGTPKLIDERPILRVSDPRIALFSSRRLLPALLSGLSASIGV